MQIDQSQDYLMCFDNPEAVTLTATSNSGPPQTIDIPVAQQVTLNRREIAASNGAWTPQDLGWLIPDVTITPLIPYERCLVTDVNDTVWTVIDVSRSSLGNSISWWKLVCRNMVLTNGLTDSINIEQCATTTDAAGAVVRTWPEAGGETLYSGLACRVQPTSQDSVDEYSVRAQEVTFDIILSQQVAIDVTLCRVLFGGQYYDCVRLRAPELTADLPVLEVRLRP